MTYEYHFGISVRVRRVKIFRTLLKLWAHFLRSCVSSSFLFVPKKLSVSWEEYPLPWKICQYVRQSKCWYLVTLLTCFIVVSMNGKKQNGAGENWTLIMYTPFFDTPFLFLEVFFFLFSYLPYLPVGLQRWGSKKPIYKKNGRGSLSDPWKNSRAKSFMCVMLRPHCNRLQFNSV